MSCVLCSLLQHLFQWVTQVIGEHAIKSHRNSVSYLHASLYREAREGTCTGQGDQINNTRA